MTKIVKDFNRVLVITLYSGEHEYAECKKSVFEQNGVFILDHYLIENKKNAEAHNELYRTIMDKSKEYDYFIKLDADMIFTKFTAIKELIQMAVDSKADVFSIPVHDYMTNKMVWGLNVYRSGVKWKLGTESLFTDQQHLDGEYRIAKKNLLLVESLVSHASMPSDFQAFAFGVHRAAKVIQAESAVPLLGHAFGQYETLKNVYFNYMLNENKSLGLALVGAYLMVTRQLSRADMLDKSSFQEDFKKINYDDDLRKALSFFKSFNAPTLIAIIGYSRFFLGVFKYTKRKLKLWN